MALKKDLLHPSARKPKPKDESDLGFGRIFSDHMFKWDYVEGKGWHNPRVEPYAPLSLDPAALIFHYGQEVFEGLKAYRGADNGIYMFRPTENVKRFNRSCKRVCIPTVPEEEALEHLFEMVRVEQEWVPRREGASMYVRPTVIATEACLGVKVSKQYLYYIIVGPVGAYYPEGFNPTKMYVEERYVRAAAGGLGEAKTSANYVASLLAMEEAHAKGFTQVLWLDACDKKTIEEVGTSNFFARINDEIVTPPLGGSILPGVTRDSVIRLCKDWGLKVDERRITIDEVMAAQKDGSLQETFATGTAAVISPIGSLHYRGQDFSVAGGQTGGLARKLYDELIGIQYGTRPDKFGWVVKVC